MTDIAASVVATHRFGKGNLRRQGRLDAVGETLVLKPVAVSKVVGTTVTLLAGHQVECALLLQCQGTGVLVAIGCGDGAVEGIVYGGIGILHGEVEAVVVHFGINRQFELGEHAVDNLYIYSVRVT